MINYFESCSLAISTYLVKNRIKNVWLPEDICDSLIDELQKHNITCGFYPINRGWGQLDHYDFSKVSKGELIIVSDLFNFRNINSDELKNNKFALDLAHCSIDTAQYYLDLFSDELENIPFLCISMGKGKYYRFGGGGILIENDSYNQLSSLHFQPIKYVEPEVDEGLKFKSNTSSTRMILSSTDISNLEIQEMRNNGFSISDGLYSHIKEARVKEYYLWKVDKR